MLNWLYVFVLIEFPWVICLSTNEDDRECMFTVLYSNGSRSWCIDEQCSNHVDIISIEDRQCRTNYLSLKFSSFQKYNQFIYSHSLRIPIASFFSLARPNRERLFQIEFLSPLDNSEIFELRQLQLLSGPISNIDTYELIFNGNISKTTNSTLFVDKEMFSSEQQTYIDTLRLIFNCSNQQRVEWELIKSIDFYPQSPCQQQIQFSNNNKSTNNYENNCFHLNFIIGTIAFVSLLVVIIIGLLLWIYQMNIRRKHVCPSNSHIQLIESIDKF